MPDDRSRIDLRQHVPSGAVSAGTAAADGTAGTDDAGAPSDVDVTAGATAAPLTNEERRARPGASTSGKIPRPRRRPRFDRGPRPLLRGVLHERSTWGFLGSGIALIVVTAVDHGASLITWMSALYVLCLIGSMGVSALYHLGPWRSESAVLMWRRADHAMIAVFIAGTYGPVSVMALPPVSCTVMRTWARCAGSVLRRTSAA